MYLAESSALIERRRLKFSKLSKLLDGVLREFSLIILQPKYTTAYPLSQHKPSSPYTKELLAFTITQRPIKGL